MVKMVNAIVLVFTLILLGCSGGSNRIDIPKEKHEVPKNFSMSSEKSEQGKPENTSSVKLNN